MSADCNVPSNKSMAIEATPLRTLTPMFPSLSGIHSFTPPDYPSMVCIAPFGPDAAWYGQHSSLFPSGSKPAGKKNINKKLLITNNLNWTSNDLLHSPAEGSSQNRQQTNLADEEEKNSSRSVKRKYDKKKAVKVGSGIEVSQVLASDNPRESVDVVLMTFDALRRRLVQLDETKDGKPRNDLKAGSMMLNNELRVNKIKMIGQVPGVEVGDIFYSRIEMCLVGVNSQTVAGIDYITAKSGVVEEPLAISIISAGVYDNADDDPNLLIYTGQGMPNKDDQKLERGNLALDNSKRKRNAIRVIRGVKDNNNPTCKIYIYDGLFTIMDSWVEKAKTGFSVFKYKLFREPDQPDAFVSWKLAKKWLEDPSSRGNVVNPDISNGMETHPVFLVNEINGDGGCSCRYQNGGDLPYSVTGILVRRKSSLNECSDACQCSLDCRNRVTQRGTKLHFEVFRTRNRGWGLRCWEPIRAGAFICEYTGEVIDETNMDMEENNYIFRASHDDQYFRWNHGPELLGESSRDISIDTSSAPSVIISAKNTGNMSRFMNHSCSPNVFWQPVLFDHGDERYSHIMFFALKHVPSLTELTYDYGQVNSENAGNSHGSRKSNICLCGSENCRGTFY